MKFVAGVGGACPFPRAMPLGGEPTDADRQVLAGLAYAEQRRDDEVIGVGFGENAHREAAADAIKQTRTHRS